MCQGYESHVIDIIKEPDVFAIQLDKASDISGNAQFLALNRFVCNGDITEQFLFCKTLWNQQNAKAFLMLSTVISVLTICHGNNASASA
jgi:hypothetical protein